MKHWLLLLTLLAAATTGRAQGTINFANVGAGLNAPVNGVDGTTRLAGTGFTAELLVGQDANSLTPVAGTTTFLTGANAGYFVGGTKVLPGFAPGTNPWFQVRVWDNRNGTLTTFSQAIASGSLACSTAPFILGNMGGNALGNLGSPPSPPATLLGLAGSGGFCIPEPAVMLLGLCGATLLRRWCRR